MAFNNSILLLTGTDTPPKVEEKSFKGSSMTKRGVYAALSYMACSDGFGNVTLIVLGAVIAGARDLSFDFYGYLVVFLANISTAIYLATIARIGKSCGRNSFGLMWCNGIICGPVLLVVLLLSCILAFFLNYSIFLNTVLNSALTQTICGNLKDLFSITIGWIIFGGLPFDILNVIGQLVGFIGSGHWEVRTEE